ncbi:MAG: patatin-like phospholipase family protein [Coriobacteriia bacterium]|nr:patatin-like phospholipase family protein [Coriobacteriia bacterium]
MQHHQLTAGFSAAEDQGSEDSLAPKPSAADAGYVSRRYVVNPSVSTQPIYHQVQAEMPQAQQAVAPARPILQLTQEQIAAEQLRQESPAPAPQEPESELPPLTPLFEPPKKPAAVAPLRSQAPVQIPPQPSQMAERGQQQAPVQPPQAQQTPLPSQQPYQQRPTQVQSQAHQQTFQPPTIHQQVQAQPPTQQQAAGQMSSQPQQQPTPQSQHVTQAFPVIPPQPSQMAERGQQQAPVQPTQAQQAPLPPQQLQQQDVAVTSAAQLPLQSHQQALHLQQQVAHAAAQPLPQQAQAQQAQPSPQPQQALQQGHPQQLAVQRPHYSEQFLHSVQNLPQHGHAGSQLQHIPQPQIQIAPSAYSKFKLPVIPGVAPRTTLPQGVGLVLEGGGTRGFYSAGVFEAFMDAGIMFPYIAAVSAGAANVLSYISGQRGRNRLIVERLVGDPRYLSGGNLLRDRSLFNFDFIFKTIPKEYLFFDQKMFDSVQTRLLTGALDCREGKTVWFEKSSLGTDFTPTIASCSIPLVSRMVRFDNRELFDGGILDPIPVEKSVADGNRFHVIVLTQNFGYIKPPSKSGALLKMAYRKYPHLLWALKERHEAYNRQVALAERLEREGRAIIIRPHNTVDVSRIEADPDKLIDLYDEGHLDGALAVDKLHQLFRF